MTCPYCALRVHFDYDSSMDHVYMDADPNDPKQVYSFYTGYCPSCQNVLIIKRNGQKVKAGKSNENIMSLITKTFQATHCFDHIAFPQRL